MIKIILTSVALAVFAFLPICQAEQTNAPRINTMEQNTEKGDLLEHKDQSLNAKRPINNSIANRLKNKKSKNGIIDPLFKKDDNKNNGAIIDPLFKKGDAALH